MNCAEEFFLGRAERFFERVDFLLQRGVVGGEVFAAGGLEVEKLDLVLKRGIFILRDEEGGPKGVNCVRLVGEEGGWAGVGGGEGEAAGNWEGCFVVVVLAGGGDGVGGSQVEADCVRVVDTVEEVVLVSDCAWDWGTDFEFHV